MKQVIVGGVATQTVSVLGRDGTPVSATVAAKVVAALGNRRPIHDRREKQDVSVTPVDVTKLGSAIMEMNASADPAKHFNGIVHFSDESADANKRAFRLENASQLPTYDKAVDLPSNERGFSVATDAGLYIRGDYNSYTGTAQVPSAVLADAVTILSNNWKDENAPNPLYGVGDTIDPSLTVAGSDRRATDTTVRTA
ncbi:MAG TPA: hypothetical protein VGO90_00890, partial [Chthoniobacteraceae bacterium]|nr:hypothetical protein [Chthoniobacteraceae bacterium]